MGPYLWELEYERPAALVLEAMEKGARLRDYLELLARNGDGWRSRLAAYLLANEEALEKAVKWAKAKKRSQR